MSSITPNSAYIINPANYTFPVQLPLSVQIPPNAQSYTVTPPESTASGGGNVRGYRLEDVGRLSDIGDDGENVNAIGTKGNDIKEEIIILEEDENSPAAGGGVQMVNVRPNGKITLCDSNSNISRTHPSSLAHMKEVMKDILKEITSLGNFNELIVLQGADRGVAVHRSVIAHYSKLVQDELMVHPDCSSIFLNMYSSHILQKVVTLLYEGECFFPDDDKKQVNLVWEVMRHLQIKFNDNKSFFIHAVDFGVKEEIDDDSPRPTVDPPEVDQTDEIWYEDHQTVNNDYSYDYMKVRKVPHPVIPNKECSLRTNYAEGVRILRGVPALAHINADEIQAQNALKDKEETKKLLEKNKIIVVNLSDNEDVDGPTPTKKSRIQSYPASTTIVRDAEFKRLVASGKVNLRMIKGATANCKNPDAAVSSTSIATMNPPAPHNYPLCSPPAPFNHEVQFGDAVISATIPGNNPARTGITIIQPSASPAPEDDLIKDEEISPPPSPTKSISGMPVLQLCTGSELQVPKRRTVHARSLDITEGPISTLPTLDRMMVDDENQGTVGGNDFFPENANGDTLMLLAPAAVIPKARVNNFLPNRQIPSTSASVASQMENAVSGQQTPKRRRTKTVQPPSPDVVEATAEMRIAYAKEEELKQKFFYVGSEKVPVPPVPDHLREKNIRTIFVENMDHHQNDHEEDIINSLPEETRAILSRHETTSEAQLVADPPAPKSKRGRKSPSGRAPVRGRPSKIANLNRSYPDVTMTEVAVDSSEQTHRGRSRGGRRGRGSRGGGRGQ